MTISDKELAVLQTLKRYTYLSPFSLIEAPERTNSSCKLLTAAFNPPGNSHGATKNFGLPSIHNNFDDLE
jgi:hypothetical protein